MSEDGGLKGGEDGGAGAGAYGALCKDTANGSDCESKLCAPFNMGAVDRCTKHCTADSDCPAPAVGCAMPGSPMSKCKFAN